MTFFKGEFDINTIKSVQSDLGLHCLLKLFYFWQMQFYMTSFFVGSDSIKYLSRDEGRKDPSG